MKNIKVICFLLIVFFFLTSKSYSQEFEFDRHTISTRADGAYSVYAVDVDDDGDMDVLSASWEDGKIAWYENLQISNDNADNILLLEFNDLTNYPNPFNPSTAIEFSIQYDSNVEIVIYNIRGQKIKTIAQGDF